MDSLFIKCYARGDDCQLLKASAIRTNEEFISLTPHESALVVGVIRLIGKLSPTDLAKLRDDAEGIYKWLA